MAKLSLIKISAFLNKNSKNAEECINSLKEMLLLPDCNIKDEINQEIAQCLTLLKQF
jgi:hypothetical protein